MKNEGDEGLHEPMVNLEEQSDKDGYEEIIHH